MSVGEFSGYSSDTAINPVIDEALPTPIAEPFSGVLDHNLVRADGQSHVAVSWVKELGKGERKLDEMEL